MNIINDNKKEAVVTALDPFAIFTLVLLAGAAFSSFFLAPLPLLSAQWRLPNPWPKAVAVLGSVVAVVVLETPVPWAIVAFVLGVVFADQAHTQKSLWRALNTSVAAAFLAAIGLLVLHSQMNQMGPLIYWQSFVHTLVESVQVSVQSGFQMDWPVLESLLVHQGGFFLVGLCLISCWVSLGTASHFGWLKPGKRLSGSVLRKQMRLSPAIAVFASGLYIVAFSFPVPFYILGLTRIVGCVLFIHGTVCLSDILSRRKMPKGPRTWIYVLSVLFGFYALLALGVVSPWYFRAAKSQGPESVLKDLEENETV